MTPDRFGFILWLSLLAVAGLLISVYVVRLNRRAAREQAAREQAERAVERANAYTERWRRQVEMAPPTEDLRGTARLVALHQRVPWAPPMNDRDYRHDPPVSQGGQPTPVNRRPPRPYPWVDEESI